MRALRIAVAAALAAAVLAGCDLPAPPHRPTGSGAGNGTPFTDPEKAEMYKELTRPLPYRGGDKYSHCGEWSAATPEDARQMRAAHQRCVAEGRNP